MRIAKDHEQLNVLREMLHSSFGAKSDHLDDGLLGTSMDLNTLFNEGDFETYFISNLLKKVENVDVGVNPDDEAITDFSRFLVESPERLVPLKLGLGGDYARFQSILENWMRLLSEIFIDFREYNIVPRHTYGATLTTSRRSSLFARVKAGEGSAIVRDLDVVRSIPLIGDDASYHTQLMCVPKTAFISRIIGTQPANLLAVQNGVGDYMTNVLKRKLGIDITTAQVLHRDLAQMASVDFCLSTIDQRKASDNISRTLCSAILPRKLFQFLDKISPPTIKLGGMTSTPDMMCPAGNGYIFPFQTILYATLVHSIQMSYGIRGLVKVYGDDLICAPATAEHVVNIFPLFGLTINVSKSFIHDGPRESCGGDFIHGSNVRGLYVKHIPQSHQSTLEWIRVINGIRRIGYYNNDGRWRSDAFRSLWLRCCKHLTVAQRLYAPRHYGDTAISTEFTTFYKVGNYSRDTEGCKYTNGGESPVGSERIRIYNERLTSTDGTTFLEEARGLSADVVFRILPDPSMLGAGGSVRKDGRYRYPIIFNRHVTKTEPRSVPYTLYGNPPEDIDELWDRIKKFSPDNPVLDPVQVVDNYNKKLTSHRTRLIELFKLDRKSVV